MNLKLILQATGQSWVLEPSHDYIAGSDRSSDIDLSAYPDVAGRHLRLSCDRISNTWYVQDLDTSVGTYIDGEAISRSLIEEFTTIKLANHIVITAEPVTASAPVSAATVVSSIPSGGRSSSYNTEDVRNNGFREVVREERSAVNSTSADQVIDRAAEYAKVGLAGANKLVQSVLAAANEMNERSMARDQSRNERVRERSDIIKIGYGGLSSPTDGAGINIPNFSMATTLKVDRKEVGKTCEKLYGHVHRQVSNGTLGNAKSRIVTYFLNKSSRTEEREARKYILVTHNTKNDVRTTIFMRFLSSGDNLFVGIDVYILGELNKDLYLARIFATLLLILLSPITIGISALIAYFVWDKVRKRMEYEGDIRLARRQEFPGPAKFDAFDEDDVLIFIKTTLHAAADSISKVFSDSGLPVDSLDAFMKQVETSSSTVINNYGGSMDMRGAAIGAGNKAGYLKNLFK